MAKRRSDTAELARSRLDWASKGIDRLEELVDAFLETKPSEVFTHVKVKGKYAHFSYVLRVYRQPSPEISFAAGDVIHNLRSTLDNLVWGLGQINKANNRLGLEFYDSETCFRSLYLPKISKLPDSIRDWITTIQPYNRENSPPFVIMPFMLQNLWNRDKHRTPTVVSTAGMQTSLGVWDANAPAPFEEVRFTGTGGFKDQEQLASAIVTIERRGDFKPEFTPLVAFDKEGPVGLNIVGRPESVVGYLRHIHEYVLTKVVPKFEPYFS